MNRFDALTPAIENCFTENPDLTPYTTKPNQIPLDQPNPGRISRMDSSQRFWAQKTKSLDWSHPDGPDSYWLNRIIWSSLHADGAPYPARAGERPSTAPSADEEGE
jgi:hypothetical protein